MQAEIKKDRLTQRVKSVELFADSFEEQRLLALIHTLMDRNEGALGVRVQTDDLDDCCVWMTEGFEPDNSNEEWM